MRLAYIFRVGLSLILESLPSITIQVANSQCGNSCSDALPLSLLQRGSEKKETRFRPAGWFGGFSQSESNFNQDVAGDLSEDPESLAEWQNGLEIHTQKGFAARWFHESASGGKDAAWQTHFPAVTDSDYANSLAPPWQRNTRGRWQQRYKAPSPLDETDHPMSKGVSWFDSNIGQVDAYGRQRAPQDPVDVMSYSLQSFSSNTTLRCKEPGCTANATINVSGVDTIARCRLSVWIHPTDFDDEHSREEVEWVTLNGVLANMHCDPMARGCARGVNEVAPQQQFTCLQSYDVTELLKKSNGMVQVAAKISKMVDECAIDGNLLSGGVDLACLRHKPTTTTTTTIVKLVQDQPVATSGSSILRCRKPGCTARAVVFLNNASLDNMTKCYLTVSVRPTDFDKLESEEEVQWIKADEQEVQKSCKPKGSPCRLSPNATNYGSVAPFECISNLDVTNASRDGQVVVTAKISDMVDECDYNGFLLYGNVTVRCTPPQTTNMTGNTTTAAAPVANSTATTTAAAPEANSTATTAATPSPSEVATTTAAPAAPSTQPQQHQQPQHTAHEPR